MTQLNFKINNFQGPFDILLHLIQKNEMEIYNINLSEITSQYLAYLDKMKELDLEITSEFIVIAATLIEIKSKELLPKRAVEEEEEEEDQALVLKRRLVEYKKVKVAVEYLKGQKQYSGTVYAKKPEVIEDSRDYSELFINISIIDLYNKFLELITNYNNRLNKDELISDKIAVDMYRVEDKVNSIKALIEKNKIMNFYSLMQNCSCKLEIVVTFLALLEMTRQRLIAVRQEQCFNNIIIERISANE